MSGLLTRGLVGAEPVVYERREGRPGTSQVGHGLGREQRRSQAVRQASSIHYVVRV